MMQGPEILLGEQQINSAQRPPGALVQVPSCSLPLLAVVHAEQSLLLAGLECCS